MARRHNLALAFNEDLRFQFSNLPSSLHGDLTRFFSHVITREESTTPPIPIAAGVAPPHFGQLEIAKETEFLTVRQGQGVVVFESEGGFAWADLDRGQGGILVTNEAIRLPGSFTARVIPLVLLELAALRGWVGLHAAAISANGLGILLPGPGNCGKSTIFTNAREAGLDVLSDDLVWVSARHGLATILPFHRGAFVQPAPKPTVPSARLGLIVVPTIVRQEGSDTVLLDRHEALEVLLDQSTISTKTPSAAGRFRTMARMCSQTPTYLLHAGQPTQSAIGAILTVVKAKLL